MNNETKHLMQYIKDGEVKTTNITNVFPTKNGDKLQAVVTLTEEAKNLSRLRVLLSNIPQDLVSQMKEIRVHLYEVAPIEASGKETTSPDPVGNEYSFEPEQDIPF